MSDFLATGMLPDHYEQLAKTVRDFAQSVVAPVAAKHDEEHSFPYKVVSGMADMGLFGLPFPEEYGGMGGDYFALCLALEELGKVDQSVAITLEAAGNTYERRPGVRTWPTDAPLTTQTTTATKAMAYEPFMVPAGGTWRTEPTGVGEPMPCRTTRENDAIAIPPLLIPVEGRDGKDPATANAPPSPAVPLACTKLPVRYSVPANGNAASGKEPPNAGRPVRRSASQRTHGCGKAETTTESANDRSAAGSAFTSSSSRAISSLSRIAEST